MKITTYKKEMYRDCPVYLRSFGKHFEYLTVINGEIYTTHISVNPTFIKRLGYFLCLLSEQYTKKQLVAILRQITVMAKTTIDTILDKK